MKSSFMKIQFLILFCFIGEVLFAQIIPFNDERWTFEGRSKIIENFEGKNSVYIQGGVFYLEGEKFKNGIFHHNFLVV